MKETTVSEVYDNHPNHPANGSEQVARYGYISPNQFPDMDERGRNDPAFKGLFDETFDIEEAEKVAQDLANEFGQSVTVDVTDENGEAIVTVTVH